MFTDHQKKIAGTNDVTLEMDTVISKKPIRNVFLQFMNQPANCNAAILSANLSSLSIIKSMKLLIN